MTQRTSVVRVRHRETGDVREVVADRLLWSPAAGATPEGPLVAAEARELQVGRPQVEAPQAWAPVDEEASSAHDPAQPECGTGQCRHRFVRVEVLDESPPTPGRRS